MIWHNGHLHKNNLTGHGVMQTGGAYMPNTKLYYMIPDDSSVSENISAIKAVLNGQTVE